MKGPRLSEAKLIVLKIGGSVITDKTSELVARTQEIDRLASEVQQAKVKNLIIVHGGGSFGHPLAQKYAIKDGLKENSQKMGFSETHHIMTVLNGLFMDSLIWHNVPAVSITPSSFIITENGRVKHFEDTCLRTMLKMGFTPVLYGDAVLDTRLGFTILSGDQLVSILAARLGADRVVIGVDVDGLYDADPKSERTARILRHLTLQEMRRLQDKLEKPHLDRDVTGGMPSKITELLPAVDRGIPVTILNACKPGNVRKALEGQTVEGTVIRRE
jgi:isopentenyl phosphate kinase